MYRRFRSRLLVRALEERVTPTVANPLANVPEANQATLTANFTQSGTAAIAFGDTVVVAFNDSGSLPTGNRFTGYARSTDGGVTFTDLGILSGANNDAGEPVFARDKSSGRIYLATSGFTQATTRLFRSDDVGLTFSLAGSPFPGITSPSFDKAWLTVDNFNGTGEGNVYCVARNFGSPSNGIVFSRSTDGGSSWSTATVVAPGVGQGSTIVVNPDHSLNAFYFEQSSPPTIKTRLSTNFGTSWSVATTVATLVNTAVIGNLGLTRSATNAQSFRTNSFPQAVASRTTAGVIYLVYPDKPAGADKADIFFVQSNNFGAAWSAPVRVNQDGGTNDQFQPTIAITPNGSQLSIGWYDRRDSSDNSAIDYFARQAALTGTTTTFGPELKLSNASFLPDFGRDNVVNTTFMGDYDQGGATNSRIHHAWGDNRLGGPDVRVASVAANASAPQIFKSTPTGVAAPFTGVIDIHFNQAMDPLSFALADVLTFTRDGIDVSGTLTGFSFVNGDKTLRLTTTATVPGVYTYTLGTDILSATGQAIDDNLNGIAGEVDDRFIGSFILPSATITSHTPGGAVPGPVSSVTINFSQLMDTNSYSPADIFSFSGTAGNLLPSLTGFQWVTSQQLRIDFAPHMLPGNYQLVLNPTINSQGGFPLDNNGNGTPNEIPGDRYTANFAIGSGGGNSNTFGYRFAEVPLDNSFNIQPNDAGVTPLTTINTADDAVATVALGGANTFTYYGVQYTSVFVSSNGNIHFGTSNDAFNNTNLVSSPSEAFIAGLWDDLVTIRNTALDDVILTRIQNNHLVVNWRNVHFINQVAGNDDGITFQIVLQLNTGSAPGAITMNYTDLTDSGSVQNNGVNATVGIRDAAPNGDPLVAAFNGNNPTLIATGKAVRFFKNVAPTAQANGPYNVTAPATVMLSSAGSTDTDGDVLTFLWDLDGDGTFGETGAKALRGDETGPAPTYNPGSLPTGSYTVALRAVDPLGNIGDDTATVNVTSNPTTVTGFTVNGGAAQRSRLTTIEVNLSAPVNSSNFHIGGAVTLTRLPGSGAGLPIGHVVNTSNGLIVSPPPGNMTSTITLTFANVVNAGVENGSLADGRWQLAIPALGFTSDANDVNLRRLFGDADGNGSVTAADFNEFRLVYGGVGTSIFDGNGDNQVTAADFNAFRLRYGAMI